MKKVVLGLFSLAVSISAQELSGLNAEKKIIVKYKDTLWSIAQKEYGDGNLWEKIYKANSDLIKNPDLIYPEDEILLPQRYENIVPEIKISSQTSKSVEISSSVQVQNLSATDAEISTNAVSLASLSQLTVHKNKDSSVKNIKEPMLNEEMPEGMVFTNITNKTVEASKNYFEGRIVSIVDENGEEKEGLAQEGDELRLKIDSIKFATGDIFDIYSKMFEKNGKITAQISGRCEIIYVDGKKNLCRLIWVNGFVEEGMLIKKK